MIGLTANRITTEGEVMKLSRMYWAFFFGWLFQISHTMFMQDLYGKDKWMLMIDNFWIDMHWIWGLLLMCVTVFCFYTELKTARTEFFKATHAFNKLCDELESRLGPGLPSTWMEQIDKLRGDD